MVTGRNAAARREEQRDDPTPRAVPSAEPGSAPGGDAATPAAGFDRLIHERLRLGIVSALAVNDALGFTELKALLGASDGNLSVHARKLEDAGYVACRKFFEGRHPRTEYRLTPAGRAALDRYLDHMERLIRAARSPRGRGG